MRHHMRLPPPFEVLDRKLRKLNGKMDRNQLFNFDKKD